jgi:hypothetical protein
LGIPGSFQLIQLNNGKLCVRTLRTKASGGKLIRHAYPARTGGMTTFGNRQARRSTSGQGRKPSSFVRQILTSRR